VGGGIILANFRNLAHLLDPYIMALYGTPKVALAPLFIVWFGIGLGSKVVFVTVIVFFLVIFNTIAGLLSTDPYLIFSSGMFDVTGVFAGIIILAVLAMLINEGVKYAQGKILDWKPDYQ
jgi:ABC-type nitrate/sulfonate/bicarbonate transport system permease component